MIDNHLNIIGTGGHAKVVLDIAKQSNYVIHAFYDDNSQSHKTNFIGFNVISPIDKLNN
jgi:FlaA1/EpsC-like NDP-sugar epimerase